MKRLSKFILILLSLSTILNFFCACGEPKHEHVFDIQILDEEYLYRKATCREADKYYSLCECGEKGPVFFYDGEPLGHIFGTYIYNNDEACEKNATETALCMRVGCFEKDTKEIPDTALSHDMGEYVPNGDGTMTSTCLNGCGKKDTIDE